MYTGEEPEKAKRKKKQIHNNYSKIVSEKSKLGKF